MTKRLIIISFLVFICYAINAQTIFYENFELPEGNDFLQGWVNIPTSGSTGWSRAPLAGFPVHDGRYARIVYGSVPSHDSWLITPAISLTQGKNYTISFWLFMPGGAQADNLEVKVGNSQTITGMTHLLFDNNNTNYAPWTLVSTTYTPNATGNYYLGWHAYSPIAYSPIVIDDILVVEQGEELQNDLQNITKYPYSQVPVSQILPPAKVKNIGLATQTDIVLTAKINGAQVGTSAALASLASGATADLTLAPAVNVPQGQNTMTYTVTQSQTDENPDNNICTFTYKGTQNVYAVDEVVTCSNGTGGNTGSISFGHIYNINQTVTLSQVIVGFGSASVLEYSISLYAMTGELVTAATPIFTQTAIRNAEGFAYITVPATQLTPGNYFLCVDQISGWNILVSYDANPDKTTYSRTYEGNLYGMGASVGAAVIRMVMQVSNCNAAPPANLTVNPTLNSATFAWQGTTPLYFLLTLSDGTNSQTFTTTNNTLVVNELQPGTSYTWKVAAMCDAIHGAETVGEPFTTQECTAITTFPFTEGFENEVFPPPCWSVHNLAGGETTWSKVSYQHHSGEFSAGHNYSLGKQVGWLITPQIEIPNSGNLLLDFWSINTWENYQYYNGVWVSITGDDPTTSTFTEIKKLTGNEISEEWKKITIPLSSNYAGKKIYIGFKYESNDAGDYADGWFVDDVKIWDFSNYVEAELASILTPNSGEGLTSNENVKVLVKNNGSDPLTNFKLKLELDGVLLATETYTNSIASLSQAEYTFNAKLNLSAFGTYEIKVTLEVANDQIPDNNSQTKKVANFSPKVVKLYGYRVYDEVQDPSPFGFISFHSNKPEDVTRVNDYEPAQSATSMYAGEYVNGAFYAYTATESGANIIPKNFVKISTETWTDVSVSPITTMPRDMAYDYTTNVMYGVVGGGGTPSNLVTINLETGAMTTVGAIGRLAYTLACSPEGFLFAVDADGFLCAIDKTTAALNIVGMTGKTPYYVQTMTFDQNTGRLFWAMCNNKGEGKLMEIDPTSGVTFDRGAIGGEAELIGLYTIKGETGIYSDSKLLVDFTIYPNPVTNDLLRVVRSTADKTRVEIYNSIGLLVKSFEMNEAEAAINVAGLPAGVYLIRLIGNETYSVQRFVKAR